MIENENEAYSDIACLSGFLTDKEIVIRYNLSIATIQQWKSNPSLETYWKRIVYEFFVRYIPEKDKYTSNELISELDIKRNLTHIGIGLKLYDSFMKSSQNYKKEILKIIEHTPFEVFKKRIDFIKECIDTRENITKYRNDL